MRHSFVIVFLLVGLAHGFFGPISQVVNNVGNTVQAAANQVNQAADNFWNNIKSHFETVLGRLVNTANEIHSASEFLWANVFEPAIDLMIQGGQTFANEQLNTIGNIVGQPIAIPENSLSEKYRELVARLKSNVHHLYENVFLFQEEALKLLQSGEFNLEERIRVFYDKIEVVYKQMNDWAMETKTELETYATTIQEDLTKIVNQYSQRIDNTVNTLVTLFKQLIENLMKHFLQVAQTVIPNALEAIEKMKAQGLLTFLP